ncbi:MAG: hypothetical protein K7J46_16610 [Bryobacter sp.]|jgi:hypothetical protein|nr:hypothetical protein [Bryobacter sp. CoA8 C33]
MERIYPYRQQVAAVHPVSLVSVIGGSFFLDFVAAVDFTRIILFDKNVAEFSKAGCAVRPSKGLGRCLAMRVN